MLATDVLILIMPSWILHNLNMPLGRKLMTIAFLSFGIAVAIVGAYRTSVLIKVFVIGEVTLDPTYGIGYTLSNIESGLAIIGVCGPTIKHMLGFCIPALGAIDESNHRNYTDPKSGSHERKRSRFTKGTNTQFTSQEIDEVELTEARREEECEGQVTITKTVAWEVESAHPDSGSVCEQNISTPRNIF